VRHACFPQKPVVINSHGGGENVTKGYFKKLMNTVGKLTIGKNK
jgi:hypothetical protein